MAQCVVAKSRVPPSVSRYLDESARWLLVRGRMKEALKVVDRAARWNRVEPLPLHTLNSIMDNLDQEVLYTLYKIILQTAQWNLNPQLSHGAWLVSEKHWPMGCWIIFYRVYISAHQLINTGCAALVKMLCYHISIIHKETLTYHVNVDTWNINTWLRPFTKHTIR